MKEYYVIQLNDGNFFKIDNISGGHPIKIKDFEFCEKYDSKEFAECFLKGNYAANLFKDFFMEAKVRKVTMTLEDTN